MEGSSARPAATRQAFGPARAAHAAGSARSKALMIAHVVLFKPKAGLDPAGRQRLVTAFEEALRGIPSIRRARIGRRVTHGRPYEQLMAVDYEYAAIIEFDDVAGLKAYLANPAHDALGARFFESFEAALMYDYELSEADEWV